MPDQQDGHRAVSKVVLIAEDEEPIAQALSMIVEDAGYTALTAINGKQALELARAQRPSLIITDLMMPLMSGAELIATLREDAKQNGRPAPVMVLMSAAGRSFTAPAGADAILAKPFDIRQIEIILAHFLGAP